MSEEPVKVNSITPEVYPVRCVVCNGHGDLNYGKKICHACSGRGFLIIPIRKSEFEEEGELSHGNQRA